MGWSDRGAYEPGVSRQEGGRLRRAASPAVRVTREMRRALVSVGILALTLGLLASGCGGSDDGDGGETRIAAPPPATRGAATRDIRAEAQRRAEAIVLQLSDFPTGWRASAHESGPDTANEFYECLGADYSRFTITGDADSQDFAMGESTHVESGVRVYETERDAEGAFAEGAEGLGSTGDRGLHQGRARAHHPREVRDRRGGRGRAQLHAARCRGGEELADRGPDQGRRSVRDPLPRRSRLSAKVMRSPV